MCFDVANGVTTILVAAYSTVVAIQARSLEFRLTVGMKNALAWFSYHRGLLIGSALVFGLPIILVGSTWLYAGNHAILPGLGGCQYIRDTAHRINCYARQISKGVKERGAEATQSEIDDKAHSIQSLSTECHMASHPAGMRAGRVALTKNKPPISLGSKSWCTQGYEHGFLIGYLGTDHSRTTLAAKVDTVCADPGRDAVMNCVHSFGHVFARTFGSVDTAAGSCIAINNPKLAASADDTNPALQDECLYGMNMEYGLRLLRAHSSNVGTPCNDLKEDRVVVACARFLPIRATMAGKTVTDSARTCSVVTQLGNDATQACARQFGSMAENGNQCSLMPTKYNAVSTCEGALGTSGSTGTR